MGQAIPNPDLDAETAEHIDLGVDGSVDGGRFHWSTGVFFSRIDDAIQRVDNVLPGIFQLQNVGEVEHKGFEVAGNAKWTERIETGVRYAYIDAECRSNPAIHIFGTPENEVLVFAKLKLLERLLLIPSYTWTDTREVTSAGKQVGKFERLDLRAEAAVATNTTLSFGVTNLLDRNQELDEGFPEEGRSYFVNLRYEF
jgi:iron complex outermembrane receptor protein